MVPAAVVVLVLVLVAVVLVVVVRLPLPLVLDVLHFTFSLSAAAVSSFPFSSLLFGQCSVTTLGRTKSVDMQVKIKLMLVNNKFSYFSTLYHLLLLF